MDARTHRGRGGAAVSGHVRVAGPAHRELVGVRPRPHGPPPPGRGAHACRAGPPPGRTGGAARGCRARAEAAACRGGAAAVASARETRAAGAPPSGAPASGMAAGRTRRARDPLIPGGAAAPSRPPRRPSDPRAPETRHSGARHQPPGAQ
ncbi:hypothetical protein F7P10_15660 [Actinomadura sp. WMMB 499]|nr:hypothetical protein F7P10_15660 [Actinomadura sp. WMMB 499]